MSKDQIDQNTDNRFGDRAEWKMIQKNTFTRWVNERLKLANKQVYDLATDLSDGLSLISLVEILSGKKLQRYTKRPTFRPQKMENITMALRFLQSDQKIKIVNIDSSDIVDQNLKLILGLVYTLILHYSISIPNWGDDDEATTTNSLPSPTTPTTVTTTTPKQRLLTWVRQKLADDLKISNFTRDWNDGRAIGALVDAVAPGLCPDWEFWRPEDAVKNATEAMTAAERWLQVPQLIRPEEMCNSKVDEQSIMTYLAQFPNATLLEGAPLRTRTRPSRVRTFGPGIERKGVKVGEETHLTVETYGAGNGEVDVIGVDSSGKEFDITKVFNNDTYLTYSCTYQPTTHGSHTIRIYFAGREIPKSPFLVEVSEQNQNAVKPKGREALRSVDLEKEGKVERNKYNKTSENFETNNAIKVVVKGPGIQEQGVNVGDETAFSIYSKDADNNGMVVGVVDPTGRSSKARVMRVSDGEWVVNYTPRTPGTHNIHISSNNRTVISSPFAVNVSEKIDYTQFKVGGRGIQNSGLKVNEEVKFKVTSEKGQISDDINVEVVDPGRKRVDVLFEQIKPNERLYAYRPSKQGPFNISVQAGNKHLDKSPYEVVVVEGRECMVKAYGPSLEKGVVGKPAAFCLETNGETGALAFSIEGSSKADIECMDNEDGSALITFFPTLHGEYAIHILCDDQDIPGSPFISTISPPSNPFSDADDFLSKIKVFGPLIETSPLVVNNDYQFSFDTSELQNKPNLEVGLYDATGNKVNIDLVARTRDVTTYNFTPRNISRYTLLVSDNGVMVDGSPYRLICQEPSDPTKVRLDGPALHHHIPTHHPSHVIVDCSLAGPGDVAIMLTDDQGRDVVMETEEFGVNSFKVTFTPAHVGVISGKVYFSDHEIPSSPFNITVTPSIDLSNISLHTSHLRKFLNSPVDFQVDTGQTAIGDGHFKAVAIAPTGRKNEVAMEMARDGLLTGTFYMKEPGKHMLEVSYEGYVVGGGALEVEGIEGGDPSLVKVYGPGIESGFTNSPQSFTVETRGAGDGGLNVGVSGPSEAKVKCRDNRDGTCSVEYLPRVRGDYQVAVTFIEQNVKGSPFKVDISDKIDYSKLKLDDLDRLEVVKGHSSKFKIDARGAGRTDIKVNISDSQGFSKSLPLTETSPDVYEVVFFPSNEGLYTIDVCYGGRKVKSSKVQVKPAYDPSKVRVDGEGVSEKGVMATKQTTFNVDISQAGNADLFIAIEDHLGKPISHTISNETPHSSVVTYKAQEVGHLNVKVKFGGALVPGAPFVVPVIPHLTASESPVHKRPLSSGINGHNHEHNQTLPSDLGKIKLASDLEEVSQRETFDPMTFNLPVGPVIGLIQAKVETPLQVTEIPEITNNNHDQTVTIKYQPSMPGEHVLMVDYNDQPLPGVSPLRFNVLRPSRIGKVKALGPGLSAGFCRAVCSFNVTLDQTDHAGLAINIDGPSKAEIDMETEENGLLNVSYKVKKPGRYLVSILYAHQHIKGSPYNVSILPFYKDSTLAEMFIGSHHNEPVGLGISLSQRDLPNIKCLVSSPGGSKQNASLKIMPGGMLGALFSPKEEGTYSFDLMRSGQPITGSAIQRFVPAKQCANVEDVRVYGDGLTDPRCNHHNFFYVDYKSAGVGGLNVSIDGPSKVLMETMEDEDRVCKVRFTPLNSGTYILTVLFSDQHVLGSPFLFNVKEPGTGRQQNDVSMDDESSNHGEDEDHAYTAVNQIGKENLLHLAIPELLKKKLNIYVFGPSGVLDSCYFKATPASFNPSSPDSPPSTFYSIGFVAKEIGTHLVHVNLGKTPISGSPYKFLIGPLFSGRNDVNVVGDGLMSAFVNIPGTFTIDSSKAGDGNLSITMEGGVKPDVTFRDGRNGTCNVTYVCSKPGVYLLSIKFNGDHVRGSPFAISVKGEESVQNGRESETMEKENSRKVYMPKQPAYIEVHMDEDMPSKPDAIVICPSNKTMLPIVQELGPDHYAVRFIPRENGLHVVEVKGGGKVVQRVKVFVGEKRSDPSKVKCSNLEGIQATAGERVAFDVDTSEAGVGALDVIVDGPSKVFITCDDTTSSPYLFHFEPPCPGIYKLEVVFDGMLVPQCSNKIHVKGSGKPLPWNEVSRMQVFVTADQP